MGWFGVYDSGCWVTGVRTASVCRGDGARSANTSPCIYVCIALVNSRKIENGALRNIWGGHSYRKLEARRWRVSAKLKLVWESSGRDWRLFTRRQLPSIFSVSSKWNCWAVILVAEVQMGWCSQRCFLGMGSSVQSGLELIIRTRIRKFWIYWPEGECKFRHRCR